MLQAHAFGDERAEQSAERCGRCQVERDLRSKSTALSTTARMRQTLRLTGEHSIVARSLDGGQCVAEAASKAVADPTSNARPSVILCHRTALAMCAEVAHPHTARFADCLTTIWRGATTVLAH